MSTRLDKLEKEALALPEAERAALAAKLVDSLSDSALSDADEAWVAEVERRYGEYKEGKRTPFAEKGFFEGLRKDLSAGRDVTSSPT